METYRQGDVLIIKLPKSAKITQEATPLPPDPKKGVVLAYGEVSGHAHALDASVCSLYQGEPLEGQTVQDLLAGISGGTFVSQPTDRVLDVKRTTFLVHDEHDPIQLEEGQYVIRRQREFDPEMERLVAD